MNQTKKRLSIIKLAISITDIETIQLQIFKLGPLKTDEKIQDIIAMLQTENYAQAQGLITTYIETQTEEIVQRSSQEKKRQREEADQSTIDEFQLFVTHENPENKVEIDINDYINDDLKIPEYTPNKKPEVIPEIDINDFLNIPPMTQNDVEEITQTETQSTTNTDFDSFLNMDADDVLSDNINLRTGQYEEDNFFTLPSHRAESSLHTSDIPKDTFFDTEEDALTKEIVETSTTEKVIPQEETTTPTTSEPSTLKEHTKEEVKENTFPTLEEEPLIEKTQESSLKELNPSVLNDKESSEIFYKSMPYIAQKLESMRKQYPSSHAHEEPFSLLSTLLTKISQESYNEEEIEEMLEEVKKLKETEHKAQAAQLLLTCAATPSPFAQLILARELYQGVLLTQNIPQSFILLNTLAMDDYPEALCDLGQFYENGIGSKKDKKRAQDLYKSAMDFGIKRAKNHYERLKETKKGFFSK